MQKERVARAIAGFIIILAVFLIATVIAKGATSSEDYIPSETETETETIIETEEETETSVLVENHPRINRPLSQPEEAPAPTLAPVVEVEVEVVAEPAPVVEEEETSVLETEPQLTGWDLKMAEYPVATTIWLRLTGAGFSPSVTAGIVGNMMIEVGGGTLNLNPTAGTHHYGICQWSSGYNIWGAGLEEQINFLLGNIEYEMNTYGGNYCGGFNFASFVTLQDPSAAADAFARCYERCGSGGIPRRQNCANVAYNYFMS